MSLKHKMFTAILLTIALIQMPSTAQAAVPASAQSKAPQHAVPLAELQKDAAASAATRQKNEVKVEKFFATPQAREAMKKAGVSYEVVQQAVSQLSQDELARLAAHADKAQKQFEAGALTNQQLTYIIIALATAVIVILILKA
jgi:hypothetical protein